MRGFLESRGYLNARIDEPQVQGGGRKAAVAVEEGELYRLGAIEIRGAKVFTPERLLEKLNLKTGNVADGQELRRWVFESLTDLYADEGYLQSDFELEPIFKRVAEKEGIADLKVTVNEGRRFTVGKIEFAGNARTSDRMLRNVLLIKEDEPFSRRRFRESIEKLNALGLFKRIDADRDVDFRSDAESPFLNIKIRVKERKPF